MDRRTIFFVLSLSLTLLAVNMFFEQRNQGQLKEWHAQEKSKKQQKIAELKKEILERTASVKLFPVADIYSSEGQLLTKGLQFNDFILTTPWTTTPPNSITANKSSYQLFYQSSQGPVVYQSNPNEELLIGELPYFGTYDIQLIALDKDQLPKVILGSYQDGAFTIPEIELAKLQKEFGEEAKPLTLPKYSLALMKTQDKFLPVGIYNSKSDTLIQLEQIDGLKIKTNKPSCLRNSTASRRTIFCFGKRLPATGFFNQRRSSCRNQPPFYI